MPYVPEKDREMLDPAIEDVAEVVVGMINNSSSLIATYKHVFWSVAFELQSLVLNLNLKRNENAPIFRKKISSLADTIFQVGNRYDYERAFLGGLNYAITRFIQRVPQIKVASGDWSQELRYWIYASTVEALMWTSISSDFINSGTGISGVFVDVKDEWCD